MHSIYTFQPQIDWKKNYKKNIGWLKYIHIKKLDNNKVGKNENSKANTPPQKWLSDTCGPQTLH
jgi:hypothetical protein